MDLLNLHNKWQLAPRSKEEMHNPFKCVRFYSH